MNLFTLFSITWLTVLEQNSLYSVYYYDTVNYIYPTLYYYYSLCQLTQLEKLDVGYNPFNTVPQYTEVVPSLASLKELNMSDCNLSNLPERFVCRNKFYITLNIQ